MASLINLADIVWALCSDFVLGIGCIWLAIVALGACAWAIRLYQVQPTRDPSDVGWSDKQRSLLIGVPIFAIGVSVLIWVAHLSML